MPPRRLHLAALALLLGLATGTAASAETPLSPWDLDWHQLRSQLALQSRLVATDSGPAVGGRSAVRGARAHSGGWAGLRFWASGSGYSVGRRSAGYGVQLGAAWHLDDRIDLTAGYRVSGFTLGHHLEPDLTDVDDQVGTPFLGLDLEF